jgi:hypothetical protein
MCFWHRSGRTNEYYIDGLALNMLTEDQNRLLPKGCNGVALMRGTNTDDIYERIDNGEFAHGESFLNSI